VKLAFVTPWYGKDIPGGAEAEVRRTAEHLRAAGLDIEVWTTCVRDFYADWGKNYHRPGIDLIGQVPVRRFPVQSRDRSAFDAVNLKLMNNRSISADEECLYVEQMLRVEGLYDHIARHADERLLFFIPYLFATTYFGVQVRPDRAYVIPCLHDEAYARLNIYRRAFESVRGMLFHSVPEAQLAAELYDLGHMHTEVIGEGVDLDCVGQAEAFRRKYHIDQPFVLYAGRHELGKNVGLLVDYFRRYRSTHQSDVRLVLIGPGDMPVPIEAGEGIIDLGLIPSQDKWDAYAAAAVVCQPSVKESFSLTIMEAWAVGTPVLVHAQGAVTSDHCQRANGGLYFSNYAEFEACLEVLLTQPDLRRRLGQQGHAYVLRNFSWDVIVDKYRLIVAQNTLP
jgi:glycosyltransferase involved in cell wall biosynthesis